MCVIDDREYSDASASRFRAPLDKGPVNGRPLSGRSPRSSGNSCDAESIALIALHETQNL
jgi:hypothetical protein